MDQVKFFGRRTFSSGAGTMENVKSRFHRTQSKVWWANEPPSIYDVLSHHQRSHLSPNTSAEERHGSPQSHKSQDSGFSDADTSNRNCLESLENSPRSKLTPKKDVNSQINEHINLSRTPSSTESEKKTPPTVIRRHVAENPTKMPHIRRISFSASEDEGDSMRSKKNCSLVRGRIVQKTPSRNLIGYLSPVTKSPDDDTHTRASSQSPSHFPPGSTSTPNSSPSEVFQRLPVMDLRQESPRLAGHSLSVEHWVESLRTEYCHEVLSTLQSKSVAAEVTKAMKMNATLAARLIRHLQTKAMDLERIFIEVGILGNIQGTKETLLCTKGGSDNLPQSMGLLADSVTAFVDYLERKVSLEVKDLADCLVNNRDMVADLQTALPNIDDFETESLLEDIHLLRRCVLITVRRVFESLLKIIVSSIEDSRNDLILRANLWTISMLSNFEYQGFSSLNPAFEACDTVRVLLLVVVESSFPSIRALALRALASVCSTEVTMRQLEQTGGVEILAEVISHRGMKRTEPELREAVSVLAQITAPWHGDEHKIRDLQECLECLVESITDLACWTKCCQTLLLCTACLNNLSRLEATSIYSLMAHESIGRVRRAIESRGPAVSIFLHVRKFNNFFRV
uniref:Protein inscuteable homologue C-terminal domain-containing protein n=1 Tax=Phlebotomus papatasi TaxID=29031 RepID=A0A1B0DLS2_PHLPP